MIIMILLYHFKFDFKT